MSVTTPNELVSSRVQVAFLTSALLPRAGATFTFDFFATLISEVLVSLQERFDVVVRVPSGKDLHEASHKQRRLLDEILRDTHRYAGLILSPLDIQTLEHSIADHLRIGNDIHFFTVDQSFQTSPAFNGRELAVPPFVVPDNKRGGEWAAKSLWRYYNTLPREFRPDNPLFVVVKGKGASQVRANGFRNQLSLLSNKKARVRNSKPLPFTSDDAYEWMMGNKKIPWVEVVGIFCCNDEIALGIRAALEQWTREEWHPSLPVIVGFDGINDVTRLIDSPEEPWIINTVCVPINAIARDLSGIIDRVLRDKINPANIPDSEKFVEKPCDLYIGVTEQKKGEYMHNKIRNTKKPTAAASARQPPWPLHFVVITVRDDEYSAVKRRIEACKPYAGRHRTYMHGTVTCKDSEKLRVALVQTPEQGPTLAQDTARDAIEDLDPLWIALVGIGGAIPETEFSLGDVVIATRLHDFCVGAYVEGKQAELTNQGGPMAKPAQDLASLIVGLHDHLTGWESVAAIGQEQPPVSLKDEAFYGSEDWIQNAQRKLGARFGNANARTHPIASRRAIASAGYLIKDTKVIELWQQSARDLAVVEMELPGVYAAAHRNSRNYPILAIRAVSDVVGFKRDPRWTAYACESAASFFLQLLRVLPARFRTLDSLSGAG